MIARAALGPAAFGRAVPFFLLLGSFGCSKDQGSTPPGATTQRSPTEVAGPSGDEPVTTLNEALRCPAVGDSKAAGEVLAQVGEMMRAQMFEDAASALQYALTLDPANLPALLQQGYLLCDPTPARDPGHAVRSFRLARLVDANEALAPAGEGIARALVGDLDRAEVLLESAVQSSALLPAEVRGKVDLALAQIARQRRQNERARTLFASALNAPGLPTGSRVEAARELALIALEDGDDDAAWAGLQQALSIQPLDVGTHYHLARLARRRGDSAAAEKHARIHGILRELEDQDSRRFEQDEERRIALRRQLLEAFPEYTRGRPLLIRDLVDVGQTQEASAEIDALAMMATSDRARAEVCFLRARAQARAGLLDQSEEQIAELRRFDPQFPADLLRQVLRDWKRSSPEITEAMCQEKYESWTRAP